MLWSKKPRNQPRSNGTAVDRYLLENVDVETWDKFREAWQRYNSEWFNASKSDCKSKGDKPARVDLMITYNEHADQRERYRIDLSARHLVAFGGVNSVHNLKNPPVGIGLGGQIGNDIQRCALGCADEKQLMRAVNMLLVNPGDEQDTQYQIEIPGISRS